MVRKSLHRNAFHKSRILRGNEGAGSVGEFRRENQMQNAACEGDDDRCSELVAHDDQRDCDHAKSQQSAPSATSQ